MSLQQRAEQHEATLRERKKQATRQALRIHALELFARDGFSKVTVEDIAAAAGVSPRTFFNYFPSKEAVLFGPDLDLSHEIRQKVLAQPATLSPLETLAQVFADHASAMADELREVGRSPGEVLELVKLAADDPDFRAARATQMASLERALAEALAERAGADPRRDPYPFLLASTAVAAARIALYFWANSGGEVPLVALTKAALRSLGDGLERGCEPFRNALEKGERTN